MFPALYSAYRKELEQRALFCICPCYYYDLADTIDSMTDAELEEIVAHNGIDCDLCEEG